MDTNVLTLAYVWVRRLLWGAGAVLAVFVILEAIHLYELLATLHAGLAWAVAGLFAAVVIGWPAWLLARYTRMPRVISPPDLPPAEEGWSEAQMQAYRRFAVRFLRNQQRNDNLDAEAKVLIPGAIERVTAAPHDLPAVELERKVQAEVDPVLAPLDAEARRLIRRASVEVALATAVSPSILLDSLITLNRNLALISRLADLYYGRPGLLGTLRIVRGVIGSAVTAGALEVVSDQLTGAVVDMTGAWSARLVGPLGQGMINGVVTMRFGAAAQVRCRSLRRPKVAWQRWRLADYRRAVTGLLNWVTEDVGPSVFDPLQKVVLWTGKATDSTVRGGATLLSYVGDKVKGVFRGKSEAEEERRRPPTGDPVLDGGLLD